MPREGFRIIIFVLSDYSLIHRKSSGCAGGLPKFDIKSNQRPEWQTVVEEHTKFLNAMKP